MDERRRFVARLLEGEKMAPLCAAFRISRKTGDKIFDRYKDCVQYYEERHREQQIRVIKKRAATLARWTELLSEYRHRRNCGFQRSLVMLAASNPSFRAKAQRIRTARTDECAGNRAGCQ